jgi:hypothetical protein
MPKNKKRHARHRGKIQPRREAPIQAVVETERTYAVYAYRPGATEPELAHFRCACGEKTRARRVVYGPLPPCAACGAGLVHDRWLPDEQPLYFIDRQTRNEWADELRVIQPYCRGKVFRLTLLLPPRPQPSETTKGLSDGVVMGRPFALACLAAWTPADRPQPKWKEYGRAA